MENTLKIN